jgi:hypothetical protein
MCKEGKYGRGKPCSPRHEASGELTGEEEAAAKGFDDGRARQGLRGGAESVGQRGEEEERKGERGKGRLTGGAQGSASRRKRKRRGEVGRRGCWLTGRWAVWAERGAGEVFLFFFFKLHFQTIFLFKFKSNFFSRIL